MASIFESDRSTGAERHATFHGHHGRGEPAVIYGRTSKDRDDAFSVADQVDKAGEYVQRHDFYCPRENILTESHTGTVMNRPQLNELRKRVKARAVKHVVIYRTDRLARKTEISEQLLDFFTQHGVTLHVVTWGMAVAAEDENARMMFQVESVFGDREARLIRNRTRDGKLKKLSTGTVMGNGRAPYGYDYVGKKLNTRIARNEPELGVVLGIFEEFDRGISPRMITEVLDRADVKTPSVKKLAGTKRQLQSRWTTAMIYSILREPAYIGKFYHGKRRTVKVDGERRVMPVARDEWQLMEFPELAIIPMDLWTRVQQRLDAGRHVFAPGATNKYLMGRRLKCAKCGYAIKSATTNDGNGKRYSYYRCESRDGKPAHVQLTGARCFQRRNVPVADVDGTVWAWVEEFTRDPELLLAAYKRLQSEQKQANPDADVHVQAAREFVKKYERDLAAWAQMRVDGDITPAIFKEKKAELDAKLRAAQDVLKEYEDAAAQQVITDREIRNKIEAIKGIRAEVDALDMLTYEHQRAVVEALDVRGILGEAADGDTVRAYVDIVWAGKVRANLWVESDSSYIDQDNPQGNLALPDRVLAGIHAEVTDRAVFVWRVFLDAPGIVMDAYECRPRHVLAVNL